MQIALESRTSFSIDRGLGERRRMMLGPIRADMFDLFILLFSWWKITCLRLI